jgi:hypothetical protein
MKVSDIAPIFNGQSSPHVTLLRGPRTKLKDGGGPETRMGHNNIHDCFAIDDLVMGSPEYLEQNNFNPNVSCYFYG